MRRWMLLSSLAAVAVTAGVFAYELHSDDAATASVAAVEAAAPVAPSVASPPPTLPAVAAAAPTVEPSHADAVPEPTGDAPFDQMAVELTALSDHKLEAEIGTIDAEVSARKLVERANAGSLSDSEQSDLGKLLQRRDALMVVKAKRLVVALQKSAATDMPDSQEGQP
jgi:hypothetical protein